MTGQEDRRDPGENISSVDHFITAMLDEAKGMDAVEDERLGTTSGYGSAYGGQVAMDAEN